MAFTYKIIEEQKLLLQLPENEIAELKKMFLQMHNNDIESNAHRIYLILKRIIDIIFSGLFLGLFFIWIFPVVALLIKFSSRGPIFFLQKRTGLNGKDFLCYKFRSMVVNKTSETEQAIENDVRITAIGKFLRISHLDETPQFLNIFLGDMSLVGPRPHMIYHTELFAEKIPYFNLRHKTAPGLTGMAQIKGYKGEINTERDIVKRVQWDIYYLNNQNIGLDIRILVTTVGQVLGQVFQFRKS